MAKKGVVFGSGHEVSQLADLVNKCIKCIEEQNEKADKLVRELSANTQDNALTEAEEIVNEVKKLVNQAKEPAEETVVQLKKYAAYLVSIGKP